MATPDPLILQPPDPIAVQEGLHGDELLSAMFESMSDFVQMHALALPAFDREGRPLVPPSDHVLDHLVRANDLVREDRLLNTLEAGTVAVVVSLPTCDVCQSRARYDVVLREEGATYGANLCTSCYAANGSGTLGASGDVYMVLISEVSPDVIATCNELLRLQDRDIFFR